MASYQVLTPPGAQPLDPQARFVRDGFSPLAFLVPFLWFFFHRMYVAGLLSLVIVVGSMLLFTTPETQLIDAAIQLSLGLFCGFEGQNLYSRSLQAKGWTLQTLLSAQDLADAEQRYYGDAQIVETSTAPANMSRQNGPSNMTPVLGLFAPYGGTR